MPQAPQRRLHVAIVAPYFPLERDERGYPHVMETIERLAAKCDVDVIALRDQTPHAPYRMAGAEVRRLGLGSLRGPLGRARVLAAGVREVLRIHRRAELDLVHGWWVDEPGAVATIAARLLRRPSIVSVLGGELVAFPDLGYGAALARGGRWTTAMTFRLAGAVTVGSVVLRNLVERHRPGSLLLPLGVDVTRFRPGAEGKRPHPARRVLFVGALEPVKNPALATRTFARLAAQRPDLRLEVWGEGACAQGWNRSLKASAFASRSRSAATRRTPICLTLTRALRCSWSRRASRPSQWRRSRRPLPACPWSERVLAYCPSSGRPR